MGPILNLHLFDTLYTRVSHDDHHVLIMMMLAMMMMMFVMCLRLSPDKRRAARLTVCLSGCSESTALARWRL